VRAAGEERRASADRERDDDEDTDREGSVRAASVLCTLGMHERDAFNREERRMVGAALDGLGEADRRLFDVARARRQDARGAGGGAGRFLSEDAWANLGEDEPGELVDGRLAEEEVPDVVHEVVVTWLSVFLGAWLLPRGGVIGGAARFLVGPGRGRKTDVFVY